MKFGPVPPKRVPKQDSAKVLLLAERWQRAQQAQASWAERARKAVDFFEGRQWTQDQLAEMKRMKRPALTFNIINRFVRLVLGYHAGNKSDITFKPGQDSQSSEATAEALSRVAKAIAEMSALEYVDVEVFADGLVTGRGYYDTRLDFDENDLGECMTRAADPFSTYPDPDCDTYDLNETAAYVSTARNVSLDEIELAFGLKVAQLLKPFITGQTPIAPISSLIIDEEITPVRNFSEVDSEKTPWWDQFYSLAGDFVDTRRKTIRLVEMQHKVAEPRNVIIDLETGDKKVLPLAWDAERIQKVLLHCELLNNPCVVQRRMVERIQWTTMAGDLLLYDAPSFYDGYTITGYFPYFRRGVTRGMVEDLIDPQMEKNKRRSAEVEIVSKSANGGWKVHKDAMTPKQKQDLRRFGSTPGTIVEWQGENEPEQIQPNAPPMAQRFLEQKAEDDVHIIAGLNESSFGDLDRVQSGRAIEARQRQAVLAIQSYMDNFRRSKELLGKRHLGIIQNHYTEQRLYRVIGEDGKFAQVAINQQMTDPASGITAILNDVTRGKYSVVIDEAPISATFLNAQFEEMMEILEKIGPAIGPMLPMLAPLIVGQSSLPRKDEWIAAIQQALGMAAQPAPPPGPGGPGQGQQAPAPQGGNVIPFNAATGG